METHPRQWTLKNKSYRIVVRAEIGERFALAFEGMEIEIAEGRTIITGEVIDQSHLHGILDRINALGLVLISVQPVQPPEGGSKRQSRGPGSARSRCVLGEADRGSAPRSG